jgi:hypothetical protein
MKPWVRCRAEEHQPPAIDRDDERIPALTVLAAGFGWMT